MREKVRRRLMRLLVVLLATCAFLLVGCPIYDAWALRELDRSMAAAEREPGTPYLKGGAPVSIDRGRDRVCLLLHGFGGTPADFGALPQALDGAGWDVWAPLLPGCGTDPRVLKDTTAEDIIDGAAEELTRVRARYRKVVVVGFSLGGAVATILAEEDSPDALVLVNPYYRVRYMAYYVLPPRAWHRLLSPMVTCVVKPAGTMPVKRPEGRDSIVNYDVVSMNAISAALRIADRARLASPGGMPVLMLVSEGDRVVSPAAVRAKYEELDVSEKYLFPFRRSDHLLMVDYDREAATDEVLRFLDIVDAGGATGRRPAEAILPLPEPVGVSETGQ